MRQSQIAILGAPLDLGAGRRGVDMGPSALRLAGLNAKLEALGYQVEDLGNVSVAQQESTPTGPQNTKYLAQISQKLRETRRHRERMLWRPAKSRWCWAAIIQSRPEPYRAWPKSSASEAKKSA